MTIFEAAEKTVEELDNRTALHEAAHVLTAHLLGHRVSSVYILRGDDAAYHGEGVFPDAAAVSGGAAERMAGYPDPLAGSKPDLIRAAAWDQQRQNDAIDPRRRCSTTTGRRWSRWPGSTAPKAAWAAMRSASPSRRRSTESQTRRTERNLVPRACR